MKKYEEQAYYQYLNATASTLTDVYKKPSDRKCEIYNCILSGMEFVRGKRIRILSHNHHYFSAAYLYKAKGKVWLAVFRPSRNFDVDVTDTPLGLQF